jgi:predicted chitinase
MLFVGSLNTIRLLKSLKNGMFGIPKNQNNTTKEQETIQGRAFLFRLFTSSHLSPIEKMWSVITFFLGTISLFFVIAIADTPVQKLISPVFHSLSMFQPLFSNKKDHETFSFVPGWAYSKFDNIDFNGVQTLAYYDLPINSDGTIDEDNDGYQNLHSDIGGGLIASAHANNSKVLLTITQTSSQYIASFLTNSQYQEDAIQSVVQELQDVNADGVVVDIEFSGVEGKVYRQQYTAFVQHLSHVIKSEIPDAKIAIALSPAAENQALYDIDSLAKTADKVFVMAYTFAVPEIKNNKASSPVFGYNDYEYWKDVDNSTETVVRNISSDKVVMERAWYGNGNNYPFYQSSNHAVDHPANANTLETPLSRATINSLVARVPASARAAARKNLPYIAKALEDEGILNANVLAYALATIEHETASTFEPIEEFRGRKSARRLGYEGGTNYFGRGFIQLTHLRTYKSFGERIGMGDSLVKHPELASNPSVAAKVLAAFFKDNGVARLATNGKFVAARTPINPDYQGSWIASLAWKYLEMIG